jgi:hypothetical protein
MRTAPDWRSAPPDWTGDAPPERLSWRQDADAAAAMVVDADAVDAGVEPWLELQQALLRSDARFAILKATLTLQTHIYSFQFTIQPKM